MKVASLFSGGKDSTFSIYKMQQADHEVVCLISIVPCSEDSMIFHFPNINQNCTLFASYEYAYSFLSVSFFSLRR